MTENRIPLGARRLGEARRVLQEHGVCVTVQRSLILESVLGRMDHPSAEQIFETIRQTHPEISRATVYRTLEMLVDFGLLTRVSHPGPSIRYDPVIAAHDHLLCVRCERLQDFEDPEGREGRVRIPNPPGFQIKDYYVVFRGVCGDCRKRARKRS